MNRAVLTSCGILSLCLACGDGSDDLLRDLPTDPEARAQALDVILDERPDHAGARQAARQLNEDMEESMGLLLRLELEQGRTFSFFEVEPGVLLTLEGGLQASEDASLGQAASDMSFSEIHQLLRPNAAVPELLVQADERRATLAELPEESAESDELVTDLVVDGGEPTEELYGVSNSSSQELTAGQFLNQGGCPSGNYEFCLLNWNNGAYAYAKSNRAYFRLSPVSGSMLFRLSVAGSWKGSWSALQGGYYNWSWNLGSKKTCWPLPFPPFVYCSTSKVRKVIRGDVKYASGDKFHYGGAFRN